jgi:hypothetical protein
MKRKNNQNNLSLYTILYCSRGDERRFFFCLTPNLILAMHSEIPGAAQHLMLLLMARSVLGFIDAQLVMRGRSMVVCVYIHRRAATDVLNLLVYA